MKANKNLNINRYTWAKQTIRSFEDNLASTVYDIGSRDGVLKQYCSELNINYLGFDLEPLVDEVRYWNIENTFPYNDIVKADVITFLEVIEHLNNPWISIKHLNQVLNSKGYLLITTPNPSWSDSRLHLLFNGVLKCFTQSDLDKNHHVFTPWPHIIEKLLNDNGFEIKEMVTIDGKTELFRDYKITYKLPIQFFYRLIKKIIEYKNPAARGMSYAILAQKTADAAS